MIAASWGVTALGVVVFLVTVLRGAAHPSGEARTVAAATGLLLEFLLAAGLLRLSRESTFAALGAVGAIVVLRRLLSAGVRFAVRAIDGAA